MAGGATDGQESRDRLAMLVRRQAADGECWERAQTVVRAAALRTRLADIGVPVTTDMAAALMATAMLLASSSGEWGGDYRDALADVATVGLELFDG